AARCGRHDRVDRHGARPPRAGRHRARARRVLDGRGGGRDRARPAGRDHGSRWAAAPRPARDAGTIAGGIMEHVPGGFALIVVLVGLLSSSIKVVREYERLVVFRLGRLVGPRGPGITIVVPGLEKAVRVDLRTVTMDVPSQDVITKDNVS